MNYLNRHIRQPTHCICTIGIAQQHSSGVAVTTATGSLAEERVRERMAAGAHLRK